MAAPDCVLLRTLTRSRPGPTQTSPSSPVVCRESLSVLDVHRYTRDQGSSVYFPQAVLHGDDLYDVTLTDGHCRLQVTLDPGLNHLVERRLLQPGSVLRHATFTPAMSRQLPEGPGASGHSYRLSSLEVSVEDPVVQRVQVDRDSLVWFGSSGAAGPVVPLRANRSVFLPLWNSVDYSGEAWSEAPPTQEEEAGRRPAATVSQLRDSFLNGRRGNGQHQLIVRIINKSHLMYYGRSDRTCECPYKVLLEVCDRTGSVGVVLWNSVCVSWYRRLKPGDIISLRRYRVKQRFQAEGDDIEISVNSRNPAARICVLQESSVSPEHLPPAVPYSFCNSQELLDHPHGVVCDVIGLLTFSGRPERIRSDGRGAELSEYRWLRLEDGASDRPITVKLFATSQPECHLKLHPLSVVVCTRLKLIRAAGLYLTNTPYTQVYCTGLGHHSQMSYRKLRPVRLFLQWLRRQDDEQVLSRALIGGSFTYPPPPVTLETYMKERRGAPGFLRGAELQRDMERLCYRERRTFCIQAAVTMVTYSRRGQEDRCLFWTEPSSSLSSSLLSPPSTPPSSSRPPLSSPSTPPSSSRPPLSSPCSSSSSSSLSSCSPWLGQLTPRPLDRGPHRKSRKRKQLLPAETPKKRYPQVTVQPEESNKTVILFEASMEFLETSDPDEDQNNDEDDGGDEDSLSFVTAPLPPAFPPVAMETLPMHYDHAHREEQMLVMEGKVSATCRFSTALEEYYTLRLRALSDGVSLDATFLPHSSSSSLPHSNTWTSILSHGAFSSHTPPPAAADLISMASQLANQRLVCVLEACHLGGATTELILSRAFHLNPES